MAVVLYNTPLFLILILDLYRSRRAAAAMDIARRAYIYSAARAIYRAVRRKGREHRKGRNTEKGTTKTEKGTTTQKKERKRNLHWGGVPNTVA